MKMLQNLEKSKMNKSQYERMLSIIDWYEGLDLTLDDFLNLRQTLRSFGVRFTDSSLEKALTRKGFKLPF